MDRSLDDIAWIAKLKFDFDRKSFQQSKNHTGKNGYQNTHRGEDRVGYNSKNNSNTFQCGNGNSTSGNRKNSTGNCRSNAVAGIDLVQKTTVTSNYAGQV